MLCSIECIDKNWERLTPTSEKCPVYLKSQKSGIDKECMVSSRWSSYNSEIPGINPILA